MPIRFLPNFELIPFLPSIELSTCASKVVGTRISEMVPILYGGSVKPDNASEIFSQPDADGGLIGGASLIIDDFIEIINSF